MKIPYWSEERLDNEKYKQHYLRVLNKPKVVAIGHGVSYYNNLHVFPNTHPTEYLANIGIDLDKEIKERKNLKGLHIFLGLIGVLDYVKSKGEEDLDFKMKILKLEYVGLDQGVKTYII